MNNEHLYPIHPFMDPSAPITRGRTYIIENNETDYRFLQKGPFQNHLGIFINFFCSFVNKKNKLRVCTKDESTCTYICRFYGLPYCHG